MTKEILIPKKCIYGKGDKRKVNLKCAFKKGDLVMHKYRWPSEKKRDYLFKVDKIEHGGDGMTTTILKVKENGKWKKLPPRKSFFWEHSFKKKLGKFKMGQLPSEGKGWGRPFKYKEK